jgi:addiction module HigA family antidote
MAIKLHPSFYTPVGPWLMEELVKAYGLNVTEVADKLGVTRQAMSALLNGKADLSSTMALRFEKAFGITADTLMRMQLNYDMAQAREHEDDIKVERVLAAA